MPEKKTGLPRRKSPLTPLDRHYVLPFPGYFYTQLAQCFAHAFHIVPCEKVVNLRTPLRQRCQQENALGNALGTRHARGAGGPIPRHARKAAGRGAPISAIPPCQAAPPNPPE